MQEVWSDIMQAANVPLADRVALQPQKKDTVDLTSARIFLEKPEYQKRVVELLLEFSLVAPHKFSLGHLGHLSPGSGVVFCICMKMQHIYCRLKGTDMP